MTPLELTGRVRTHIVDTPALGCALHKQVVTAFSALRQSAHAAGLRLEAVSTFRDFGRQLVIWNGKFTGAKPLRDASGALLDASQLSPEERVSAILQWSALPGASRHHWGTDVDLIDTAAWGPALGDPLTCEKFAPGGPFGPLSAWLTAHAAQYGFFRPFGGVRSGVQAEPWHLSFAPVSEPARRALRTDLLRTALEAAPLEGKTQVLARLEELHARYVAAIDWP